MALPKKQIIMEKLITKDSEPSYEELEQTFPRLFAKESLSFLEKLNPIKRDSPQNNVLKVPVKTEEKPKPIKRSTC